VFLLARFGALAMQGKLGLIFAFDFPSMMFLIETLLFVYPVAVLMSPERRNNARLLLYAAVSMALAGALYRFDAFLVTMNPGPGFSYFPAFPEIVMTAGTIALEILVYLIAVRQLPILAKENH
jgi:Ni/Fe-hydrogenase subunit HybB-like protein